MSIVTTDNTQAYPELAAAAQARAQSIAETAGLTATFTEILRFVPDNRIILSGTLDGRGAVFRLPLCDASQKQVSREWAELARTRPYMSSGPNRVADPLHFDPATGLMAISHIPGTPLLDHLRHLPQDQRAATYARAGDWLAAYIAPSTETRPANTRHWLRRAREAAAKQPHPQLAQVESRVLRQMRRLSKLIGDSDWRAAIPHGDFHPNNLILNGATLTGIDTGGSSTAPITKDMARSLTHMARRGVLFGAARSFGVDALAFDALASALSLTDTERTLHLPYLICFETLFRVEHPQMPEDRIAHAHDMAQSLLKDLRQIT
ncbi:phosphotransferase family protein [Thalassovita sp.]|uniref:phosphotransferase family protein n=1 Tax=Thalassovita sp. TaxID=1979401 RepID=UPI0029DE7E52|nr:phosphotransferase [Thalassovita sp.]